jgi:hypothetical protein
MSLGLDYQPTVTLPACGPAVSGPTTMQGMGGGPWALPRPPRLRLGLSVPLQGLREIGGFGIPLLPLVLVIGALKAIGTLVANLPQNLATANFAAIGEDANNVATSLLAIVGLANPLVAFSQMVRGFATAYRDYLVALRAEVVGLIAAVTDANALVDEAVRILCEPMRVNAQCYRNNLASKAAALNASMASAGPTVSLLSAFLCLLGAFGHFPGLPTLDPNALVAEVFDPPIAALNALLAILPNTAGPGLPC